MNIDRVVERIRDLMKDKYVYKNYELISAINSTRYYSSEEIYAALSILVDNKNEYIVDKYNRLGNLINIDDLYIFQPVELTNEKISIFERSVPIDYKHNHIKMNVPT